MLFWNVFPTFHFCWQPFILNDLLVVTPLLFLRRFCSCRHCCRPVLTVLYCHKHTQSNYRNPHGRSEWLELIIKTWFKAAPTNYLCWNMALLQHKDSIAKILFNQCRFLLLFLTFTYYNSIIIMILTSRANMSVLIVLVTLHQVIFCSTTIQISK